MTRQIMTRFGPAIPIAQYKYDGRVRYVVKDGLKLFAKHLESRIAHDYQNIIVVDGQTGSGKSNCAIQLALAMNKHWDIQSNYIYDITDLRRKLRNLDNHPILLMDEGSIILNSLNTMKRDDQDIIAMFDTLRTKHITTIVCCPNMYKLNKTFRETHCQYRLLCPVKSPIPGYAARGFVHVHSHWTSNWKDSNSFPFVYTTVFDKIPRSMQAQYDELKAKSQTRIIDRIINGGKKE